MNVLTVCSFLFIVQTAAGQLQHKEPDIINPHATRQAPSVTVRSFTISFADVHSQVKTQ